MGYDGSEIIAEDGTMEQILSVSKTVYLRWLFPWRGLKVNMMDSKPPTFGLSRRMVRGLAVAALATMTMTSSTGCWEMMQLIQANQASDLNEPETYIHGTPEPQFVGSEPAPSSGGSDAATPTPSAPEQAPTQPQPVPTEPADEVVEAAEEEENIESEEPSEDEVENHQDE